MPTTEQNTKAIIGNIGIDPTENVKALVTLNIAHSRELAAAESKRLDDIRTVTSTYEKELRDAEAKRLDSIRAVDSIAVGIAAERSVQQAATLAAQVATSADTLRNLVASTAQASATALQQVLTPLTERLAVVERSIFEGRGKSEVVDPLMQSMLHELKGLGEATVTITTRFAASDSLLAGIVKELKAVSDTVSANSVGIGTAKGAEGVSQPIMMALAGVVGSILTFVVMHMMHF
jgi:uncharacterized protein YeaO (DUF488 family)